MSTDPNAIVAAFLPPQIEDVEVLASKQTSGLPTAAAGGALLGPAGLVAGAMIGRKQRRAVRITYSDGSQEVREISGAEHVALVKRKVSWHERKRELARQAALSPEERGKVDLAKSRRENTSLWFYAIIFTSVSVAGHLFDFGGAIFVWAMGIFGLLCFLGVLPSLFRSGAKP